MIPFVLKHWKGVGLVAAAVAILAYHFISLERARRAGYAHAVADRQVKDDAATAAHNAHIAEINRDHQNDLAALVRERDAALASPVVRTIRVRIPSVCPAPADAGVPSAADPQPVDVLVPDEGFGELRRWLIHYGAGPGDGG